MSAILLTGREPADILLETLRPQIRQLAPRLIILHVGDDAASARYIRAKLTAATAIGMDAELRQLPAETTFDDLIGVIDGLNRDADVTGYILQLPLPAHLTESQPLLFKAMDPRKDVDGFTAYNVGKLFIGRAFEHLPPATPAGILRLLEHYAIPVAGKRVVIVGRSMLVGKPLGIMLLHRDATVTFCHRKTPDLGALTREADLLVSATGTPSLIRKEMVKPGATVIDVGTAETEDGTAGDVSADVADSAGAITPVPGGVGPMTVASLLANCVTAARRLRENT